MSIEDMAAEDLRKAYPALPEDQQLLPTTVLILGHPYRGFKWQNLNVLVGRLPEVSLRQFLFGDRTSR